MPVVDDFAHTSESFTYWYTIWLDKDDERSGYAETNLEKSYRTAWASRDVREQQSVLYFVLLKRDAAAFDLVIEGLQSHDPTVGSCAVAVAFSLIARNYDLGSEVRDALSGFAARFPAWGELASAAVRRLEQR